MNKTDNKLLGETVYTETLENGLKIYILPKEETIKTKVLIGTRYGSIDREFIPINETNPVSVPDGIAHFLEHKLFEKEGASALDIFASKGMDSNAYTTSDHTVYYAQCTEKVDTCIEELIKMVTSAYLTEENVEKEKGIIGQEIKMYEDDPFSSVYYNLLAAMYKYNPINVDTAGTIETIKEIDKNVLYKCYNTFYNPSNMFLCIVGNLDVEESINKVKACYKKYCNLEGYNIKRIFKEEPREVARKEIDKTLPVYNSQLALGFKLDIVQDNEKVKKSVCYEYINELYFGRLTDFYNNLYDMGYITEPIGLEWNFSDTYSYVIMMAETKFLQETISEIKKQIKKMIDEPVDDELYDIVKKKIYGNNIMKYESVEEITRNITETFLCRSDLFDELKYIDKISKEDIKETILRDINIDNMSISVVKP